LQSYEDVIAGGMVWGNKQFYLSKFHISDICKMKELLILPGALGSAEQMRHLEKELAADYKIHLLDFPGHGGDNIPESSFSIESFSKAVENYLSVNEIKECNVFGYSMGGYVAVYLAATRKGLINKCITLATKFHWDEQIAAKETQLLDPALMLEKVPAYADELKSRHHPSDWKTIVAKTKELFLRMGIHSPLQVGHFQGIDIPTLLLLGDRDKMISIAETVAVYKLVPGAQLGVIPASAHAIEKTDIKTLAYLIRRFID
jgi:pimeloyl-ACP methyl ester carboxylesterase